MPETTTTRHAVARGRGRHRRQLLSDAPAPILEVEGVTARTPGGRVLLDDVSFAVEPGWLVAIVGPTGAGKTSIARALTGVLALDSGSIRLDGTEIGRADMGRRDRIAYVPQDDVLHGQLDLGRTLAYAASLRVPSSLGEPERRRRVLSALRELGLEHHADVPVAALSGGQRKRANIAAELVGQPDVLVLDEPTSGLDPGYEKAVLGTLRQLADGGRTIVTITHSMQVLDRCDRVLFLAEGGRVAYFGPPAGAASYFGGTDAADVFLALDTEPGQTWKERFRAHPAYARYVTQTVSVVAPVVDRGQDQGAPRRPAWHQQVATLLHRQVDLLRADRRHLALLLLQGPLLGLLLRLVLAPNSLQALPGGSVTPPSETVALFVALSATWLGASNAVREIVKERHIVRREVDAGLAPSAYVVAKAIVLGTLAIVQTTVLAAVACSGQQLPSSGALLGSGRVELMVAGALVGLAATCLGLLLSSLVTSPDKALALLPMTLVTELALAGGWASTLTAPGLVVLRDLTGARWGVEAVNATVTGNGAEFARAAIVLALLTAGSLAVTVVLVCRQTRPACRRQPVGAQLDAFATRYRSRGGALVGAAASVTLVLAAGTAGIELAMSSPEADAAETITALAPVAPVLAVDHQADEGVAATAPEPGDEVLPAPADPVVVQLVDTEPAAPPSAPVTTPTAAAPAPPAPVPPPPTTTSTTAPRAPTTTAPRPSPPTTLPPHKDTGAGTATTASLPWAWAMPWFWTAALG